MDIQAVFQTERCRECAEQIDSIPELREHLTTSHNMWWGTYLLKHYYPGLDLEEGCLNSHDRTDTSLPQASSDQLEGSDAIENRSIDTASCEGNSRSPDVKSSSTHPLTDDNSVDVSVSTGTNYPDEHHFVCDLCHEAAVDDISALRVHVETDHDLEWEAYLQQSPLHRCAACESPIQLGKIFCGSCSTDGAEEEYPSNTVPCRWCAEVYVPVSDPFCSPQCAMKALAYHESPLEPPTETDAEYLEHNFRSKYGIISSAPLFARHDYVCRECYEYGSDSLHGLATHVGTGHEISWPTYIQRYRLQKCHTCGEPLPTLTSRYCDAACRKGDSDPLNTCQACDEPADIDNVFCSPDCVEDTHLSTSG